MIATSTCSNTTPKPGRWPKPYVCDMGRFPLRSRRSVVARPVLDYGLGGPLWASVVLMTVDPNQAWPPFAEREKIGRVGLHLKLSETTRSDDPVLGKYECRLEPAPSTELLTKVIEHCTRSAVDAGRIEVPFESIRVDEESIGAGKSTKGGDSLGVAGVGRVTSLRLGIRNGPTTCSSPAKPVPGNVFASHADHQRRPKISAGPIADGLARLQKRCRVSSLRASGTGHTPRSSGSRDESVSSV